MGALGTSPDHLTDGAISLSIPPGLTPPYHCASILRPGSAPSVMDSPASTSIGISDCSAALIAIIPCIGPTPACSSTAWGRPVMKV